MLPLDTRLRIGIQTIHRRTEPATGPWLPRSTNWSLVELVDRAATTRCGSATTSRSRCRSSIRCCNSRRRRWSSRRLTLGTSVYLLPLRHPAPVAKQVATLDHLTEGRLIFGVGVGGEFPREYEVCGVPRGERGARLSEGITLLRQFWSGEPVTHNGRFYGPFTDVPMHPPARQAGGPPIWCGGRSDGALRRTGRLADGWLSYVVTPDMYRTALDKIDAAAPEADARDALRHRPSAVHPHRRQLRRRRSTPRPRRSVCATRWISAAPRSAIARSAAPNRSPNASASSMRPVCGTSRWTCSGPMNNAHEQIARFAAERRCRCCDRRLERHCEPYRRRSLNLQ